MNSIIIDGVDYSKFAVYPLKINGLLDKSLDQATLTLRNLSIETPFEPMSKIVIDNQFTFLISNDSVKRDVYGSDAKYTHTLLLIEETKELEKYFVDTCTFTNSILKKYSSETQVYASYQKMSVLEISKYFEEYNTNYSDIAKPLNLNDFEENNFAGFTPEDVPDAYKYSTPVIGEQTLGSNAFYRGVNVSSLADTETNIQRLAFRMYNASNNELISRAMANTITYVPLIFEPGNIYRLEFVCLNTPKVSTPIFTEGLGYGISYYIACVNSEYGTINLTITDVVNRLLAITETRRVGSTPKFSFNSTQASYYSNVLAPEFSITKSTLREALQQVGGYIHAEPRLKDNVIYFDDLGGREKAIIPNNYVSSTSTQDIEQFCSEIDSNVDNLVNNDDEQAGTIIEPFANGWKTTRVELGTVDITDNNAFIETTKPIEKIVKVEFGYLYGESDSDVGFTFKDITPYIYESAEYSILDSYDGIYPYSKAWALYYTQGQKNIYGLQYEQQDAISPYFQKFAIINILERITGTTISAINNPLAKMQFRVTYIPVVSMRIKQHKSYLGATKKKSVLAYNASANKVDTDYYGENLKGAVARLGNIEKTITYCCKNFNDIPKAGMIFDKDYYISAVTIEFLPDYCRFTLGLSKDFNRWNEYVGINNNQRFYEVSEKQAVERYVVYEDYLIVGDYVNVETNDYERSIVTNDFVLHLEDLLLGSYGLQNAAISGMSFTGYDNNNNIISTVTMPVVAFSLGNSAIYQIFMSDNFGAGTYIQQWLTNAKGVQIQKEYGDILGNIETIKIEGFLNNAPYFYAPIVPTPTNYDEAVEQGKNIPNIVPTSNAPMFTTNNSNIILKKDNRENINFAYQIHCVTNKDNIIIGSGLSKKLAIRNTPETTEIADLYVMDREIGKFEKIIKDAPDVSQKITYNMVVVGTTNKTIYIDTITCNKNGKSVIMIDRETKELLFAINEDVSNGQSYNMPNLMFRHKIYN